MLRLEQRTGPAGSYKWIDSRTRAGTLPSLVDSRGNPHGSFIGHGGAVSSFTGGT